MLKWSFIFLIIAIIAGIFGFTGIRILWLYHYCPPYLSGQFCIQALLMGKWYAV